MAISEDNKFLGVVLENAMTFGRSSSELEVGGIFLQKSNDIYLIQ